MWCVIIVKFTVRSNGRFLKELGPEALSAKSLRILPTDLTVKFTIITHQTVGAFVLLQLQELIYRFVGPYLFVNLLAAPNVGSSPMKVAEKDFSQLVLSMGL